VPVFRPVERLGDTASDFKRCSARYGFYLIPSARCSIARAPNAEDNLMISGTVKFYNNQKGFGFIAPDDGSKDVFVHATALERAGISGLAEGQKVEFDTAEDRRTGKIAVSDIREV